MDRVSLNKLLAKASAFEAEALVRQNDKLWAWYSLEALADAPEHESIFASYIENLIGKQFSFEDYQEWMQKNTSYLSGKENLSWMPAADAFGTFLETFLEELPNKEYVYLRIYRAPPPSQSKESFKTKEEAMLQGTANIPNLYLYKIVPFYEVTGLKNLDKKYSSYFFIADAFRSLTGKHIDENFNQRFVEFLKGVQPTLARIMRFSDKAPQLIGRGKDGAAVDLGHYVLKIFRDKTAYHHAVRAIKRLHSEPQLAKTEAMIHDVGEFGKWDGELFYYYIIEKMVPASDMSEPDINLLGAIIQKIINLINIGRKDWRKIKELINDPSQVATVQQAVNSGADDIVKSIHPAVADDVVKLTEIASLKPTWLKSLTEEIIMKYLTGRTDLHLGNIGISNGEFRYFDPAFSGLNSNINFTEIVDQDAGTAVPQ